MNVPMHVAKALSQARDAINHMGPEPMDRPSGLYTDYAHRLLTAFNALDNADVFAEIDEATGYGTDPVPGPSATAYDLDAAEWGDTTRDDVNRRAGFGSGEGVVYGRLDG
jgi:hypothetical protein